jgi:hypothetical protein
MAVRRACNLAWLSIVVPDCRKSGTWMELGYCHLGYTMCKILFMYRYVTNATRHGERSEGA